MTSKYQFLKITLATAALALPWHTAAAEPTPVVTTFSILGDMVKNIGGEHIEVTSLVGPNGDTHAYIPTTADARVLSEAKVLFINGLEFEGWLDRLIDASDFNGERVTTTAGIEAMAFKEGGDHHDDEHHDDEDKAHDKETSEHHDKDEKEHHDDNEEHHDDEHDHHHGAFDPHAWQSLQNAITYVDNITAALAKAAPEHASSFYQNRESYVAEIKALDKANRETLARLPAEKRIVVTSHDAFQYLGRDYELSFLAPQGLSTDSEASARDVADLIIQMRKQKISAVFIENITNPKLLEQIANETGASIGGTLYPGALSDTDGPAATYLDMMQHNANTLAKALSGS